MISTELVLGQFSKWPLIKEWVNANEVASHLDGNNALWQLPKFASSGWFVNANNGPFRACNLNKASVVGDKTRPWCTTWE